MTADRTDERIGIGANVLTAPKVWVRGPRKRTDLFDSKLVSAKPKTKHCIASSPLPAYSVEKLRRPKIALEIRNLVLADRLWANVICGRALSGEDVLPD